MSGRSLAPGAPGGVPGIARDDAPDTAGSGVRENARGEDLRGRSEGPPDAAGADRRLIVNADDLGMSRAVNRGILEAHENGIVTSASLLVRWPAAEEAVAAAARRPGLDLGLHVDLGEWRWAGEGWQPLYQRVSCHDAGAVAAEVEGQLERFRRLVGRDPTHLDSHQHVHRREPVRDVVLELAHRLDVPLRECTPGVRHHGGFHGQTGQGEPLPRAIEVDALLGILEGLPAGVTELGCHPAADPATGPSAHHSIAPGAYRAERLVETRSLCDPRVRTAIDARAITLCGFAATRIHT